MLWGLWGRDLSASRRGLGSFAPFVFADLLWRAEKNMSLWERKPALSARPRFPRFTFPGANRWQAHAGLLPFFESLAQARRTAVPFCWMSRFASKSRSLQRVHFLVSLKVNQQGVPTKYAQFMGQVTSGLWDAIRQKEPARTGLGSGKVGPISF